MLEMIGISSPVQDSNGAVVVPLLPDSKIKDISRRVSRTQTLDGGCVITDGGFSHGDRTWEVVTKYDQSRWNALLHLAEDYSLVMISSAEGLFLGTISLLEPVDATIRFRVLLKEKLT
ncbi:MAG: hypothetical protein JXI32_01905 [Deltaproteobacteria bacterium]|nr:hypothetical protein [Deltaproteobacteria bacterium]